MSTVGVVLSGSTNPATRGVVTAVVGVAGLIVGSFVNVVVYRVPRGLSVVQPRSFCPSCGTPVRSFDNVPVLSWVVLGGRCRRCRSSISVRYPLVELATGAIFAALGWGLGPHWGVAGFCVLAATMATLVAVGLDDVAPPLSVAVIGSALATVLLVAAGVADHRWSHVVGVAVGDAAAGALLGAAGWFASRRPHPVTAASPVPGVLPFGAVLGWLGPPYAAAGLGATLTVYVGLRVVSHLWGRDAPARRGRWVEVALALGAVAAVTLAMAFGAGAGR